MRGKGNGAKQRATGQHRLFAETVDQRPGDERHGNLRQEEQAYECPALCNVETKARAQFRQRSSQKGHQCAEGEGPGTRGRHQIRSCGLPRVS